VRRATTGALTITEWLFRILLGFLRNVPAHTMFHPLLNRERDDMKKFAYVIAALGAIVIAAPSIASAETVVIKRGGYHSGHQHGYGARADMRRDRGWHRGHGDKVVIIKKRHHRDY
jgi:hypothetical protein